MIGCRLTGFQDHHPSHPGGGLWNYFPVFSSSQVKICRDTTRISTSTATTHATTATPMPPKLSSHSHANSSIRQVCASVSQCLQLSSIHAILGCLFKWYLALNQIALNQPSSQECFYCCQPFWFHCCYCRAIRRCSAKHTRRVLPTDYCKFTIGLSSHYECNVLPLSVRGQTILVENFTVRI